MKKWLLIGVMFFSAQSLLAQVDPVGNFNRHVFEKWAGEYVRISQYRVKGTPYFLGESFPGSITYKGGKTVDNINVLYDLYSQKAGLDVQNKIYEADEAVEGFVIQLPEKFGGSKLTFENSSNFSANVPKMYMQVLADGSAAVLFKAYKIKLSPDPTNTMDNNSKVFEQYYEYYVYNKNTKSLQKIKLKEKDVLNALGDDQFKKYVAQNNLNLTTEADIAKAIAQFKK